MTQQNISKSPNSIEEDEIDLIALVKAIWVGRKIVIKTSLIFMMTGLFVAIFTEKEYSASTTFVSQTGDSKVGGDIGGLAAMAGINLGNMGSDSGISPELYPQIMNSVPFQKELLETSLSIEGRPEKITYKNYYLDVYRPGLFGYLKKYTIGLPGIIISVFKDKSVASDELTTNNQLYSITFEDSKLIKKLSNQLVLNVNDKEGYVTLSAKMPEAKSSAELTLNAQNLLQKYVINFKIQKSKEQLEYIKDRYLEVEVKFKAVQQKLAAYKDKNKFVSTALGSTTLESIQDEYSLVYGIITELSKQYEAQHLQVTKDTPVFTILKPVTIPLDKSKPNRVMIIIIWTIIGVVFGGGIILGKKLFEAVKEKWV